MLWACVWGGVSGAVFGAATGAGAVTGAALGCLTSAAMELFDGVPAFQCLIATGAAAAGGVRSFGKLVTTCGVAFLDEKLDENPLTQCFLGFIGFWSGTDAGSNDPYGAARALAGAFTCFGAYAPALEDSLGGT